MWFTVVKNRCIKQKFRELTLDTLKERCVYDSNCTVGGRQAVRVLLRVCTSKLWWYLLLEISKILKIYLWGVMSCKAEMWNRPKLRNHLVQMLGERLAKNIFNLDRADQGSCSRKVAAILSLSGLDFIFRSNLHCNINIYKYIVKNIIKFVELNIMIYLVAVLFVIAV